MSMNRSSATSSPATNPTSRISPIGSPLVILPFLTVMLVAHNANAGAWLRDEGSGLSITTLGWYQSDHYWDENSQLKDSLNYRKFSINPLIEYGLTSEITVGVSAFLNRVDSESEGRSAGIGDVDLFGRKRLWQEGATVISAQLLAKVPELGGRKSPALGGDQYDLEARLLYGRSGQWGLPQIPEWYLDIETGVRKRFGAPADEFRFDWLYGWRSGDKRWEFEIKQTNIVAIQRHGAGDLFWSDYDLYKLSPAARYRFDRDWAIEAGISYDLAGRKVGKGLSPSAAVWRAF